jgi:hypothetical protein
VRGLRGAEKSKSNKDGGEGFRNNARSSIADECPIMKLAKSKNNLLSPCIACFSVFMVCARAQTKWFRFVSLLPSRTAVAHGNHALDLDRRHVGDHLHRRLLGDSGGGGGDLCVCGGGGGAQV